MWTSSLFVAMINAGIAYWQAVLEAISTRRMEQEMRVQCQNVGCHCGQEMTDKQVMELIEHSAALRVFLHWNGSLTNWSDIPLVRLIELGAFQPFRKNFRTAEKALQFRVGVTWRAWTSPDTGWRDEFSILLQQERTFYLAVLCYDTTNEKERTIVLGTIAKRLKERVLAKQARARDQFC